MEPEIVFDVALVFVLFPIGFAFHPSTNEVSEQAKQHKHIIESECFEQPFTWLMN
jgi:hypothetical protein